MEEKKESWIEKLVELLNEYENQLDLKWCTRSEQPNFIWHIKAVSEYSDNILYNADFAVTSKRYWFIKWLIENDKIDIDAYKTVYSWDLDKRKTLTMSSNWDEFYQVIEHWVYESLLMLLSIQDEPIQFLCSILK